MQVECLPGGTLSRRSPQRSVGISWIGCRAGMQPEPRGGAVGMGRPIPLVGSEPLPRQCASCLGSPNPYFSGCCSGQNFRNRAAKIFGIYITISCN